MNEPFTYPITVLEQAMSLWRKPWHAIFGHSYGWRAFHWYDVLPPFSLFVDTEGNADRWQPYRCLCGRDGYGRRANIKRGKLDK